jgi:DUF4097 and DUF4098 domain-containing protein YvlB
MKKNVVIAGIFLLTLGIVLMAHAIASAQNQGELTVPLTDPAKRGKLKAHLNSGSITVKGTARKDILVKYDSQGSEQEGESDKRNGLRRLPGGALDLEVTENSNNVVVKSDSWNNKIDLNIEVPSGFDLQVHTYNNGDLLIQNIQGTVELTNYNGEIEAANISGSVIATSYNGEIKVSFDKVTADTPMSFSTFNGDIDLTFPSTLKASLKMKTEQGDVYSGFDVNLAKREPVQKKDTKAGTFKIVIDDWMQADVNGGGPEYTMKNYNGDIYVRKK